MSSTILFCIIATVTQNTQKMLNLRFIIKLTMKKLIALFFILFPVLAATNIHAEEKDKQDFYRHEVRIGWGDQMFEKMMWHNTGYIVTSLPESETLGYEENYRYAQHIFAEYSYSFYSWLSAGMLFDASSCIWDDVTRNGAGVEISREANRFFSNYAFIPNVRFTYFRRPYINIYSGLGLGLAINTGTTKNIYGQKTVCGIAGNLTMVGISGNYKQWFATAELNVYAAAKDTSHIFLFGSRFVTLSIGMRF